MEAIKSKLFAVTIALGLMFSCIGQSSSSGNNSKSDAEDNSGGTGAEMITSLLLDNGKEFSQGQTTFIRYSLKDGMEPDSVVLFVEGKRVSRIDTSGYDYKLAIDHPTGRIMSRIEAYKGEEKHSKSVGFTVFAGKAPVVYGYKIIKTYPHATDAYTQGLLFHNGFLYESTGLEKHSSLRKIDIGTGKVLKHRDMPGEIFAEGLTLHGDKLYQLTWKNNKAFVYDINTFELLKEFSYGGEGWGLTSDGKMLYMSDGTEKIHILDPETFKRTGSISVYTDNSKVMYINELEWVNGEIWANVYTSNSIIRIDPSSGAVTGIIDMSGLLTKEDVTPETDVLNGIAFDKATGRIFVTGKNWNKLFEVEVFKK